jgi:DNA primase
MANLTAEGISLIDMEEAGLLKASSKEALMNMSRILADGHPIPPDYHQHVYERFRERIMIPIRDNVGSVIGFGGRLLESSGSAKYVDQAPKYINSPDSILFKKGSGLYALDLAKKFIQATDTAVIVEGYFDVLTLHDCGLKNVVGSLGTALNMEQVSLCIVLVLSMS